MTRRVIKKPVESPVHYYIDLDTGHYKFADSYEVKVFGSVRVPLTRLKLRVDTPEGKEALREVIAFFESARGRVKAWCFRDYGERR